MNFCVAILILKMEENKHFWYIMLYYFKRGKHITETQKRFVQCMEKCCDWSNVSKVVCEVSCWRFLAGWSGRPVEVNSDQLKTFTENNQRYIMQEIADILKISKSIQLLVKIKNVSFILWKKPYRLFGQPNMTSHLLPTAQDNYPCM